MVAKKLIAKLSSQVFYSLSIVTLFESSWEKVARLLLYSFNESNSPFRSSVHTITIIYLYRALQGHSNDVWYNHCTKIFTVIT